MELLQDPRLLERILEDFEAGGVVGEETNMLVVYPSGRFAVRPFRQLLHLPVASTSSTTSSRSTTCCTRWPTSLTPSSPQDGQRGAR
ncbi:MAG: hypothetical protein GY822_06085 [Deltaproteobacteria bacterium]|nr:hypothetical protein [Deltaproteobacteria bacterium]